MLLFPEYKTVLKFSVPTGGIVTLLILLTLLMIIGFRFGVPYKQVLEFGRVHPSVHAERPLKLLLYVMIMCTVNT